MKLRANVRPQWQWAKLKQLLAIVLMFWGYNLHVRTK